MIKQLELLNLDNQFRLKTEVLIKMKPDIIYRLIPCSMYNTYMCYVLYDEYPRDKIKLKIDITACLKGGKVVELCQRECVSSIVLPNVSKFKDIQSIRNNIGILFYIVAAGNDVILLQSTDQMSVYRRISNVVCYEVCDPQCSGEAQLMIRYESHTEYIPFSNSKNALQKEKDLTDSKPAISALKRKLTEAEYNLVNQEKAYEQIEKLRQQASFLCHGDELLLKILQPVTIIFCGKKIVIQIEVKNDYDESINEMCVFIHNNSLNSISYSSMVYEYLLDAPYYKEIEHREIKSKQLASVVAVIPLSEFKTSISSRIDFSIIISYERKKKNYLQFVEQVHVSAVDVMGKNFDIFSSSEVDKYDLCIAMLSTTFKTTLCLKQKRIDDLVLGDMIYLSKIFCGKLNMDLMGEAMKFAIHKYSPHHILHGIMILFKYEGMISHSENEINYEIDVYTRSPSQVMALIHYIYDTVPLDLIITTPSIQITNHEDSSTIFITNPDKEPLKIDYTLCADSLLHQASITLKYLDNCMVEINKSNKTDNGRIQIDLLAVGSEKFDEYRQNMLAEAKKSFEHFLKKTTACVVGVVPEIMEIGSDEIL